MRSVMQWSAMASHVEEVLTMETFIDLMQASSADIPQITTGAVAGAIVFAALLMSPALRRVIFVAAALLIIIVVLTQGLDGLAHVARMIFTDVKTHQRLVEGIITGKVTSGTLWRVWSNGFNFN
jgi:hypothetical protein